MSKLKALKPAEDYDELLAIDDSASMDGDDGHNHDKLLETISKMGRSKK